MGSRVSVINLNALFLRLAFLLGVWLGLGPLSYAAAATVQALEVGKVEWKEGKNLLEVKGRGIPYSIIIIKDASTGTGIAQGRSDKKGYFTIRKEINPPPCAFIVESGKLSVKTGYTEGAPTACNEGGGSAAGSHWKRIKSFAGTATCLSCHMKEGLEIHSSVHYQWAGDTRYAVGFGAYGGDKMGGINDFCIYPDINWLGKLTNVKGSQVDAGCAKCHVGLGEKPSADPNLAQLENIDCLVCHSDAYRRRLELVGGKWKFVADESSMKVSLLEAAQSVQKPSSASCLNCHTKAGGGNNFKRGDIEEAHRNPTAALDVHMAPKAQGGAGLSCLDCHGGDGHFIKGRGTDLKAVDSDRALTCSTCHGATPHQSARINDHTEKVNCTVCHIPQFAKVAATDMFRDWSAPGVLVQETGLFEPAHTKGLNVTPVYRFFNGYSKFYKFGDPAQLGPNGRVIMSAPVGDVSDPASKIYAFKYHKAKQPIDPETKRLLPLKIGKFFETGKIDEAVSLGAQAVGWQYNGHAYADTERYMGLFHEVAPKGAALSCSSCHVSSGRIGFKELGYELRADRNGKPLCESCHSSGKASGWGMGSLTGFEKYHSKHVTDKKISCGQCHTNLI